MPGDATTDGQRRASWLRSPHLWVTTIYFAEGFPYALVNNVADVVFVAMGANIKAIGLTALFHLPWNIKFLWAPPLDRYETKRSFVLACEVVIFVLVLLLAIFGTSSTLATLAIVLVVLGIVSATHDIAIDGYYMDALDKEGQSRFVGYRATAYRGAVLVATGPLLWVAGKENDWHRGWLAAAAIIAAFLAYQWRYLPRAEPRKLAISESFTPSRRRKLLMVALVIAALVFSELQWAWLRSLRDALVALFADVPFFGKLSLEGWIALVFISGVVLCIAMLGRLRRRLARSQSAYARGFTTLLEQPGIERALAFVVLFRAGESFLMKMRTPFLQKECGMDTETFGLINGTLGWGFTLAATVIGGWLIARHGLKRWMWIFILAQNIPNLLYAWAAASEPAQLGNVVLGAVVLVEDFGAGLGTAFFIVYLMRCVDPRHKATHMAVLTAIMSLGFTLAGIVSGFIADAVGYPIFYGLTFLATIPAMVMVRWVPYLDRTRAEEVEGAPAPG
ncbi:MAG TPA: MFS transporter [Nannocystaceae bacterium]|nr:MFS transporter [Nannocystaceae bacterium]